MTGLFISDNTHLLDHNFMILQDTSATERRRDNRAGQHTTREREDIGRRYSHRCCLAWTYGR